MQGRPNRGEIRSGGELQLMRHLVSDLGDADAVVAEALNKTAGAALVAAAANGVALIDDACAKRADAELTRD